MNVPDNSRVAPNVDVQVRINPDTGLRDDSSNVSDWFLNEYTPRRSEDSLAPISLPGAPASPDVRNQLF